MRKTHQEFIQVERDIIDEVLCNCCGKPIDPATYDSDTDSKRDPEFIHIRKWWGYYSQFDGEIHDFDICQECYKKWVSQFTIPISVEEYEI